MNGPSAIERGEAEAIVEVRDRPSTWAEREPELIEPCPCVLTELERQAES